MFINQKCTSVLELKTATMPKKASFESFYRKCYYYASIIHFKLIVLIWLNIQYDSKGVTDHDETIRKKAIILSSFEEKRKAI